MIFRKELISGIGALAFVALLVLNVQLVQNPTGVQNVSGLTLVELAAKADGGDEGICCPSYTNTCYDGEYYLAYHYHSLNGYCP